MGTITASLENQRYLLGLDTFKDIWEQCDRRIQKDSALFRYLQGYMGTRSDVDHGCGGESLDTFKDIWELLDCAVPGFPTQV